MVVDSSALFLTYVSLFMGSCMWFILVFYNLAGLFSYSREDTDGESASAMAKMAWAIGFLSFLLGPCAFLGALLAIVLSRVETGRMYSEKSSLAGATPCRMASVNGGVNLLMWVIFTAGIVAGLMQQ